MAEPAFLHIVLFRLETPETGPQLVALCERHLRGHAGERSFAVGLRDAAMRRDVNLQDFDVALQILFESRAAHDAYQVSERHDAFRREGGPLWAGVRVIDALVG